ncbi:hypothetical protein Q5752_002588 [Cryptotrichosporon argae]
MAYGAAYKPPMGPTSTAAKRIRKEIADLAHENLGSIKLAPNESNVFQWLATLPGPAGSPYEGGQFEVEITVPNDYPFSPPHLRFLTRVYHCNINSQGGICLDLLKTAWSPALSLYKVILSLSSLLTDPNPADPLVPDIAVAYKRNRKKHDETAREWTKLYAIPKTLATPAPPIVAPPAAPAPAPAASSSRATRTRPGGRPTVASDSLPPPVAGVRRSRATSNGGGSSTRPIELDDSDDDEVVVARGEPSTAAATTGRAANGTSETGRRPKRRRGGDEEVIVVD